ncbi:rRNA-binding ribosome biosynthesis protein utp25 [Terramyces sp. JEL0728]|nr:rRNA-binding ribosome biosynthesis protein utp25 [Terramyces sp. JEL0728]
MGKRHGSKNGGTKKALKTNENKFTKEEETEEDTEDEMEQHEELIEEDEEQEEVDTEQMDKVDMDEQDLDDYFESHFGDQISENIEKLSIKIDTNEWSHEAEHDEILKRVLRSKIRESKFTRPTASSIKIRLQEAWQKLNGKLLKKTKSATFTPLQSKLFETINAYSDLFYANETFEMQDDIRHLIALHTLNHVYKTRDRVLKNNAKLKIDPALELRDQGFTRPKVLIILPLKNHAYKLIMDIINLSGTTQHDNKKRFIDEFSGDTAADPRKPEDFNRMFEGNIDDCFKIGIKFSRKQLKLYSSFYSSDVIIASPLGLQMIIGSEGDKKRDFDFLSSIEVVILDHSEMLLMQNWDHLKHLMNHLNIIPKNNHGCDFSRTRNYVLDNKFNVPEINSLISSFSKNIDGRVKISREYDGVIQDVAIQVPQVFLKLPNCPLKDLPDLRFNFFLTRVLPTLRRSLVEQSNTLIIIPSYFDFVRVRNYLKEHNYNTGAISEYTSRSKVDRTRNYFKAGDIKFLLYSERYHYFRRPILKGVRHIVFYGCPVFEYYAELVNMLDNDNFNESTCTLVFSQYDKLALERIIGNERADRLIKSQKDAFMFTS